MSWEAAVKKHFSKIPFSFQRLVETVENVLDEGLSPTAIETDKILAAIADTEKEEEKEEPKPELPEPPKESEKNKNKNLELVVKMLTDLSLDIKVNKTQVKVLAPDVDRGALMTQLRDIFVPLGFEFDSLRGGTFGMLKKLSRKEGSAYIVVKPDKSTGRAAQVGADYEEQLSNLISNKYGKYGITVTTAGSGHGSDLTITGPNGVMTVEAKTSSGADFGQFRMIYSIELQRWAPSPTVSFKKNEALFTGLFKEYLEEYLNEFAKFPDVNDEKVKQKKGFVTGFNPNLGTGDFKKEIQTAWFGNRTDLIVPVDFKSIADYYERKGDKFIQIGGRGLYAFDAEDSQKLGIPMFSVLGKKANIRFRIKPEMGYNGHHSFTVAVKLTIAKSNKDLTNEEDLDSIIEKLL